MNILWITIPASLLLGLGFIIAFIWAARSDQWNDLDTPPQRMLGDQFENEKDQKHPKGS